jgi:hypothetical protein
MLLTCALALFAAALWIGLRVSDKADATARRCAFAKQRAWARTATATELAAHLVPALAALPREAWTDRELHDALLTSTHHVAARDYYETNWPLVLAELRRRLG